MAVELEGKDPARVSGTACAMGEKTVESAETRGEGENTFRKKVENQCLRLFSDAVGGKIGGGKRLSPLKGERIQGYRTRRIEDIGGSGFYTKRERRGGATRPSTKGRSGLAKRRKKGSRWRSGWESGNAKWRKKKT